MMFEERPLHSVEAEESYLGCFFFAHGKALKAIADAGEAEWFFRPSHRMCLTTLQGLVEREGAVDVVLFKRKLIEQGWLDDVGGEEKLVRLMECVPAVANWKFYLGIVRENWVRRVLVDRCSAIIRDCHSEIDTADLIAATSKLGEKLVLGSPATPLRDVQFEDPCVGVTTGFEELDDLIEARGFVAGQFSILQGDTKSGKTALMISCMVKAAQKGKRCLYATFADLDAGQLARRIMRNLCGWSSRPYSNLEAQAAYDEAKSQLKSDDPFADGVLDIEVYDAADQDEGYDIEAFMAWLYDAQREKPFDIVFVDYAQELNSRDKKADSMVAQMQVCASKINKLARNLKVPFVVGSQVTVTDKQSKTMYSRAWEQKAALVVEIPREQDRLLVKFNRFGPKEQEVRVRFNSQRVRFEEA